MINRKEAASGLVFVQDNSVHPQGLHSKRTTWKTSQILFSHSCPASLWPTLQVRHTLVQWDGKLFSEVSSDWFNQTILYQRIRIEAKNQLPPCSPSCSTVWIRTWTCICQFPSWLLNRLGAYTSWRCNCMWHQGNLMPTDSKRAFDSREMDSSSVGLMWQMITASRVMNACTKGIPIPAVLVQQRALAGVNSAGSDWHPTFTYNFWMLN